MFKGLIGLCIGGEASGCVRMVCRTATKQATIPPLSQSEDHGREPTRVRFARPPLRMNKTKPCQGRRRNPANPEEETLPRTKEETLPRTKEETLPRTKKKLAARKMAEGHAGDEKARDRRGRLAQGMEDENEEGKLRGYEGKCFQHMIRPSPLPPGRPVFSSCP